MISGENKKTRFHLEVGSVQCFLLSESPFWIYYFGRAEYDRNLPILSDSIREQATPIVDMLNSGTIGTKQAEKLLDKISW